MQQLVEAREGIVMRQFEPAAVGPRVPQPTLIVHDREDRINRFADAEAFRDAIAGARLLETSGLGHTRLLRDDAVLQAVVEHVLQRSQPADPSPGAAGTGHAPQQQPAQPLRR